MTINGINGVNMQMGQMGSGQVTDAYSRNIQDQIARAQKQLQELSSNENMTLEEKMKKRQEIQQQISDLNMQLRQHQMEQRRAAQNRSEKQQAKQQAESKSTGLSQAGMTAMISAENSIKQAKIQGGVAAEMEGKAGVLEAEIKLDRVRGADTHAKEEELAEAGQKAQAATASQLTTLADASRTMEEAARTDSRTDDQDLRIKKEDGEENVSGTDAQTAETAAATQPTPYRSVDIRL